MSAPFTMTSGALSPPIPSSARTTLPTLTGMLCLSVASALPAARCGLLLGRRCVGQDRHVFAVVTAVRADHVRPLELATILALDICHSRQRMVRPAHVAAGLRNLFLGNSHNDLHDGAAPTLAPKS